MVLVLSSLTQPTPNLNSMDCSTNAYVVPRPTVHPPIILPLRSLLNSQSRTTLSVHSPSRAIGISFRWYGRSSNLSSRELTDSHRSISDSLVKDQPRWGFTQLNLRLSP